MVYLLAQLRKPCMSYKIKIYVCPEDGKNSYLQGRAEKIARDFDLPLYPGKKQAWDPAVHFLLVVSRGSVYLKPVNQIFSQLGSKPIYPDWLNMDTSSVAGRKSSQPVIKAIQGNKKSLRSQVVLDATAGWGEDSWIMASLGFSLISLERSAIIYLLLRDAYARAGRCFPRTCSRIRLLHMDALDLLYTLNKDKRDKEILLPKPDAIYLDPMFPEQEKRKSAQKKLTRVLRILQGEKGADRKEEEELLDLSLRTAKNRVVVKRPKNGEPYAGGYVSPVHGVKGKGMRFDVYNCKT